jgi:hypothetical protein
MLTIPKMPPDATDCAETLAAGLAPAGGRFGMLAGGASNLFSKNETKQRLVDKP